MDSYSSSCGSPRHAPSGYIEQKEDEEEIKEAGQEAVGTPSGIVILRDTSRVDVCIELTPSVATMPGTKPASSADTTWSTARMSSEQSAEATNGNETATVHGLLQDSSSTLEESGDDFGGGTDNGANSVE